MPAGCEKSHGDKSMAFDISAILAIVHFSPQMMPAKDTGDITFGVRVIVAVLTVDVAALLHVCRKCGDMGRRLATSNCRDSDSRDFMITSSTTCRSRIKRRVFMSGVKAMVTIMDVPVPFAPRSPNPFHLNGPSCMPANNAATCETCILSERVESQRRRKPCFSTRILHPVLFIWLQTSINGDC